MTPPACPSCGQPATTALADAEHGWERGNEARTEFRPADTRRRATLRGRASRLRAMTWEPRRHVGTLAGRVASAGAAPGR
jgi:hypothetical protein